jgi:hypothetical protein
LRLVYDEPQSEQVATRTALPDRMVMLAVQRKEKELELYPQKIDIRTLLKMGAG